MGTKILELQGVHNFRDYGGYAVAGGGRLRSGLLWRSGQHKEASDADLATIGGLKLTAVVDLRGNTERKNFPCRRPNGFNAAVLFSDGETGAANVAGGNEAAATAEASRERMRTSYRGMPFRPSLAATYRLYFAALASNNGPTLIHCLAGKDRTGLAVALTHSLLGVHRDDIMADYLLTNMVGDSEARIARGAAAIRSMRDTPVDDSVIRVLMSVEPEYLDMAFDAIVEKHKSIRGYARDILEIDDAKLEAMRAALIA